MSRKRTVKLPDAFRLDQFVSSVILDLLFTAALFPNAVQGISCDSELQCAESGCNVTANNTQYCTACPDGLGLLYNPPNPTKCTACGNRCAYCKVIGQVCPRCVDSFGPFLNGSGIGSCGACVPVAANCVGGCNVNGAGRCDDCDNGFGLTNGNTSCTACVLNCLACDTSISYCDQCKVSYYPYPNRTCGPCASNCIVYGCAVNGAGKCDRCDLGYSLTSTNTCASCSPNCNASIGCNSPNTCITCNLGYGRLPNGTCDACASNCTTYGCAVNGAGKCDRCDLGFNLTSSKNCTPTSAVQTTSGISAGADGSQTLSRNFTSVSDWTSFCYDNLDNACWRHYYLSNACNWSWTGSSLRCHHHRPVDNHHSPMRPKQIPERVQEAEPGQQAESRNKFTSLQYNASTSFDPVSTAQDAEHSTRVRTDRSIRHHQNNRD